MEYSGLIEKYKVDRALSDEERALQLRQEVRLEVKPHYQLSVIRMNSTYLESVDKWFAWRGMLTALAIAIGLVLTVSYVDIAAIFLSRHFDEGAAKRSSALLSLVALTAVFAPFFVLSGWFFTKESFAWTHYPIRLNRKTRMVHAFRLDGTALSVPWDEVFFTLGRGNRAFGVQNWDIRGHVLDSDSATVRETFAFSGDMTDQTIVRRHWEFLRRYMEEGPQEVSKQVEFCMPVATRREPFRSGLHRVLVNFAAVPFVMWLFSPFLFIVALGRWIAMRTSKIPAWPADVEATCAIDPGDPYAIDASINPEGLR